MKKFKKIPPFKSEDQEQAFWASHDTSDYIDWSKAERMSLPNLKPSTRSISIRLPESLLNRVKTAANAQDVPYQSYIKVLIEQGLAK